MPHPMLWPYQVTEYDLDEMKETGLIEFVHVECAHDAAEQVQAQKGGKVGKSGLSVISGAKIYAIKPHLWPPS